MKTDQYIILGAVVAIVAMAAFWEARAGRIVLFPSNFTHPHQGKTPLSDDKWIVNTFFVYNEYGHHVHDHDHRNLNGSVI